MSLRPFDFYTQSPAHVGCTATTCIDLLWNILIKLRFFLTNIQYIVFSDHLNPAKMRLFTQQSASPQLGSLPTFAEGFKPQLSFYGKSLNATPSNFFYFGIFFYSFIFFCNKKFIYFHKQAFPFGKIPYLMGSRIRIRIIIIILL